MNERPILFSGAMVEAILEGRKTQTRRVVATDMRPMAKDTFMRGFPENPQNVRMCGLYAKCDAPPGAEHVSYRVRCPYGEPADRLWVRETHAIVPATAYRHDPSTPHQVSPDGDWWAVYRQGWDRSQPGRWKPSIHMPRWACRIELEVVSVRVERLQTIKANHADCLAEGIIESQDEIGPVYRSPHDLTRGHRTAWCPYSYLWDVINGAGSWAANPFVWVVEFRRWSS